jgi:hypothetical protein
VIPTISKKIETATDYRLMTGFNIHASRIMQRMRLSNDSNIVPALSDNKHHAGK